jgi:hypothetical protein
MADIGKSLARNRVKFSDQDHHGKPIHDTHL